MRTAVVAFCQNATKPEFGSHDLADLDALTRCCRRALARHAALGTERQSARREIVAYCAAVLDGGASNGASRPELAAAACLGARVAEDLVKESRAEDAPFAAGDNALANALATVEKMQSVLGAWDASPDALSSEASRGRLLEAYAAPALAAPTAENLKTLGEVAALLDAPKGWAEARIAETLFGRDDALVEAAEYADRVYDAGGSGSLLRKLARELVERSVVARPDLGARRRAAVGRGDGARAGGEEGRVRARGRRPRAGGRAVRGERARPVRR